MLLFTRLLRSPALALCLSTTAAQADLTAADLWTEWRDYASSTGYYISAREVTDSDGLTLNNLSMRMDLEETSGNSTVNIKMGTLRFIENADGSVSCGLLGWKVHHQAPSLREAAAYLIDKIFRGWG